MRVAVISDIHGNLHALEAVLDAVDTAQPDEVWCLGDLVGYGPRPNECCASVAGRAAICLAGNHDLGVLGAADVDLADFSPDAAASARWTRSALEDEWHRYLARLEPSAERARVQLFHASPRDPVWEYVLSPEAMIAALDLTTAQIVLVGHSHVPIAYAQSRELVFGAALAGAEADLSGQRWLLNPGSVGQPRDGDPRASFLLLDLAAERAWFRRVEYDIRRTKREIREQGLPDALASRLGRGE